MRKILTRLTLILVFCIGVSAFSKLQSQIVVAKWHFDNPTKQGAITDNASFASSPYTADDGIVENKDIATISLGGSVNYNGWVTGASGTLDKAPNSSAWNLTDGYWQIGIVTTGYKDLTLSSKQRSSNTGPTDFQIQYSTDNGSSWLDVGTAITVANNFTSGVVTDLALPAECNNLANLLIRWTNTSNVSVGGATVASGGTNRIDDIVVMGAFNDPCIATVPFFEGFEDGYTHATTVGGCWTQESVSGSQSWVVNSTNTTNNRTPRTGLFNATLQYSNTDWLFHKVYLTQGIVYDFSVWARQDATSGALLTLAWGAENNAAAMTNIIVNEQAITDGDYQEVRGTFTVPTDGVYYIGIKGTTTSSPWHLSIDDISLDFGPTCVAPENIQASNITSDATTITWDASITSVAAYNVYSSDVNTAPADDIANSEYTEVSGVTTTLGGLTPNTTYYVWVRSDCGSGDYSTWAGPISFTTAQIPAILPYEDDFATNQFTFINGTQTNQWAYGSAEGNPENAIYISNDDGTTNAYTNYSAISTVQAYRDIVIPTGTTIVNFSFDWKCYGESSYDYLRVWLVPTSYIPTAGTQITAGTGRIQIGGNFNQQDTWQTYQNLVLDLSSFAGQTMRLVFEWQNDGSGGTQPPAAIDNVNISIPSCIAPTNLQASLTGLKSANLTWTAPTSVPANGYQIFSNTTGVAPSESSTPVITVAATETSFATGDVLDLANTTYYAWIRSDCGGDFSSWAGPATVTTPMYVPSPWVEEFATSTTPTGWTTSSMYLNNSNSAIINGGASGYFMYKNLYSSATTGNFSTVLVGPISGTEDFSFDYKIANYNSPYAPPASGTGNFVLEISTDFGNTWTQMDSVDNNAIAGWQNKSYSISTYAGAGDYVKFRVTANWLTGGGDYCIGFDNFNLASCFPISGLSVANIEENSATISWNASTSSPANYNVYYSEVNAAPANDIADTEYSEVSGLTTTLSSLSANTKYYVWVRSACSASDMSSWGGPVEFTTSCAPESTLPYTQNFDSYSSGEYPDCWLRPVINSGFPSIVSGSSYSVSSPNGLKFQSLTTTPTYAISPAFSEDIHNLRVSFNLKAEGIGASQSGTMELGVMSNPDDIITFESVAIIQPTDNGFNHYKYDLNGTILSGPNNYIALRHNSNSSSWYYWLDDFKVELIPNCIEVSDLVASNVTANSATISWTASTSNPASYQVYCSINNTAPAEDETNVETTPENTIDLSGLSETTQYYVWVRSACGVGDFSPWDGPIVFTTLCTPVNVPFFEGFENGYNHDDVVEGCWTQESVSGSQSWVVNSTNTINNRTPRTGLFNATLRYSNEDWLFYRVNLIQGQAYDFTVWARQDATSGATLTLAWGTEDNSAAMTNIIVDAQVITNGDYQEVKGTFGVPTDGVYYIGIKGSLTYTPYYMSIDDISLDFGPNCVEPTAIVASEITANSANISWTASVSAPASYHVYYSTTNTAPADDIADAEYAEVTGLTTELSELTPVTTYYVWVRSACGADENSVWTGISFETTPSCFEPTNIQASDITINSANISWTAATESPDATYHVYYSLVDAAPADDIDIAECEAPATNSIELTDLTSSSTYYVWVRSVCGADDFSTWAGPSVFSTSCAIISEYPYFEGFNSGIDPACWTIIDNDNSGDSWYSGTYASTPSYEGASMMVSEFSYPNDDWLISPQFKITSDNLKVDFYAKSYSAYFYESFNVLISKTGTSPSDFTIVLENIVDHPNTWQNHEYILSEHGINIDDEIYVAIQHVSNDQFVLFIDAFTVSEIEIPSAEAEILTYSIPNQVGDTEITSTETEGTITVTMPFGTEVTNLVADFTLSDGATAQVDTEDQASGVTPNNFTDPVVYVVTAEDGTTTKNWTVTVNLEAAPSSEANILTYSFEEQHSPAVIDDVNHTVTVVVNEGTSLDALVATFTLSDGATAKIGAVDQESGVTENNFTDPVIYTVTAEDGTTTQPWTVTVSVYVGIEDVENSALAIYPNPNNGNFTLDFTNINGKVNYQIYDTKGSIIISDDFVANGSAIKEVSLNLVPGVYFVRLVTETQSLVEKLVVE